MSSPSDEYESPSAASNTPSTSRNHTARAKTRKRTKTGCLTCRLRKKRCDETRPVCASCTRLGIECLGFSTQRPDWTRKEDVVQNVVARLSKDVSDTTSAKRRLFWSNKAARSLQRRAGPANASHGFDQVAANPEPPPVLRQPHVPQTLPQSHPERPTTADLIGDLSDFLSYPVPQGPMLDREEHPLGGGDVLNLNAVMAPTPAYTSYPSSPTIDPAFLALLGFGQPMPQQAQVSHFPMLQQPSPLSRTSFTASPDHMRFFHHYLTVIMPYQWIFERKVLSDLVTPLAFTNSLVFESLIALAALHMGVERRRGLPSTSTARLQAIDSPDSDLEVAETSLQQSMQGLKQAPFTDFGSHEMIVATMSVTSFHLFDGGNRKGWRDSVGLCRKSLAAALQGSQHWNSEDPHSRMAISAIAKRLGHLLNPLVWTDIMTSVTEGVASQFLTVYRVLLLDDESQEDMGNLLRETVMGCDSTTRLAIAEIIELGEWKDTAQSVGRLSMRDLMERTNSIERLLAQRRWRERHLFDSDDVPTAQRRAVSDVFFHSARVLLATTLNGPFPGVSEVAAAVRDVAEAFLALDHVALEGAERALVFPTVIGGCHAEGPQLQQFFRVRIERLGEEAVIYGNTSNALRLMEEVWSRRATQPSGEEIHWRKVMFELEEEGLLLI